MLKNNLKKNLLNSTIILIIFFLDRVSKNYILKIAELENTVDIYLTSYLKEGAYFNPGNQMKREPIDIYSLKEKHWPE